MWPGCSQRLHTTSFLQSRAMWPGCRQRKHRLRGPNLLRGLRLTMRSARRSYSGQSRAMWPGLWQLRQITSGFSAAGAAASAGAAAGSAACSLPMTDRADPHAAGCSAGCSAARRPLLWCDLRLGANVAGLRVTAVTQTITPLRPREQQASRDNRERCDQASCR